MADNQNMKMKYFFQKTLQVLYSNGRADRRAKGQAEKNSMRRCRNRQWESGPN